MSSVRVRDFLARVLDWTCLQKLHLQNFVVCLLVLDFTITMILVVTSIVMEFIYVNPGGRRGFVDGKWMQHNDIFEFRRFQPWEKKIPIDWTEENVFINTTRSILDQRCSKYETNESIPGDSGDYLKTVAGHPNDIDGYNETLVHMMSMFSNAAIIMYLSEPLLLLSMWWKNERSKLVGSYVVLRTIPLILFVIITGYAYTDVMCGIDVIYDRKPIRTMLMTFTITLWVYELLVFIVLALFCIEQRLTQKRKEYGFRKGKKGKGKMGSDDMMIRDDDYDAEDVARKERKAQADRAQVTAETLTRNILELGTTTDEESLANEDGVVENRNNETKKESQENVKKIQEPVVSKPAAVETTKTGKGKTKKEKRAEQKKKSPKVTFI